MPQAASGVRVLTIPIKGMHCRSCEILVQKQLLRVKGVRKAQVSLRTHNAEVHASRGVSRSELADAIAAAGYEVGQDTREWITSNVTDYRDLAEALLVLLVGFVLFRELGLADLASTAGGSPSSLWVVLVVGLTAGVSTCMALVGGLVLGVSARHAEEHPEGTASQKLQPHLVFVLGRIVSYSVLGGLIGMAGSAVQLPTPVLGWLTILVGLVMMMLGLQLTGIFPRLSNGGLTLPTSLASLLGIRRHEDARYSHRNSFAVGALTFFLPCGFTQAMQLYAISTRSFVSGALIMGVFAIGTAPGLLGIGSLASLVRGAFARKFFKFAGVLVIALAVFNISNGLNLTGADLRLLPDAAAAAAGQAAGQTASGQVAARIEDGVQVVRMNATGGGYSPNSFTVQRGIPVRWVITADSSRSCAKALVSPQLGISRNLAPGESVIEFTPTRVGPIRFSCSMGMYTGSFNVVAQ